MIMEMGRKQKIMLWGTGCIADEILIKCQTIGNYEILGCIDSNTEKNGAEFHGFQVYAPEILDTLLPEKIVILTDAYDAIYEQIKRDYPQVLNMVENKYYFYKQSILQRYAKTEDLEIQTIVCHVKKYGLQVFNYDFADQYRNIDINPILDKGKKLYYIVHKGKRMYFSKKFNTKEKVTEYYRFLLMEQDMKSPHRYLTETFCINTGDVVVDAGAAEGNFSLEIIDKVGKLYLIEADNDWIDALNATFESCMDKVVIIKAFISDYDEGKFACLDTLIKEPVNFIKLDIEGNEWYALRGAKELIRRSKKLKIAACTYHQDFDQELIESLMDKFDMVHETSQGYMWFPWTDKQSYVSTRLNRGLVRGMKQ